MCFLDMHAFAGQVSNRAKDTVILWDDVWMSLHQNCQLINCVKTTDLQQVHLDFYIQLSYNKEF